MTITTDQVQDLQTTVETDLLAGTWTNYTETPKIIKEDEKKGSKDDWIELIGTRGDITQAINGAIIYFTDTCLIRINAVNRTDLNKLYTDLLNILIATNRNYTLSKPRDLPKKKHYVKELTIELKDI